MSGYGIEKLDSTGHPTPEGTQFAETLFYFSTAVLTAPTYGSRFAEFLSQDWPRIPLPDDPLVIGEVSDVGRRVADLLDPWSDIDASLAHHSGIKLVNRGTGNATLKLLSSFHHEEGSVQITSSLWLAGVSDDIWAFTIGGHQVLYSWLKARADLDVPRSELIELVTITRRLAELNQVKKQLDTMIAPLLG